jgi:hypothetical protein
MPSWFAAYGKEPWREDLITDHQKQALKDRGLAFNDAMTKGEASDRISSVERPGDEEIEVLKFFKVKGISKLTQLEARHKIVELAASEESVKRWEARPACKEDSETIRRVLGEVPRGLTHKEAAKLIRGFFKNPELNAKLEAVHEMDEKQQLQEDEEDAAKFEREDTIESIANYLNDAGDQFGVKLVAHAIAALEAQGHSLEFLQNHEDLVAQKVLELDPSKKRKEPTGKGHDNGTTRSQGKSGCLGSILVIVIIAGAALAWVLIA